MLDLRICEINKSHTSLYCQLPWSKPDASAFQHFQRWPTWHRYRTFLCNSWIYFCYFLQYIWKVFSCALILNVYLYSLMSLALSHCLFLADDYVKITLNWRTVHIDKWGKWLNLDQIFMYQIPLYFQKVLSPFTDILYGVENSDKAILKTIENIIVAGHGNTLFSRFAIFSGSSCELLTSKCQVHEVLTL